MTNLSNNTKNADAIQAWLVSTLAVLLEVRPHELNINEPLSHYGLNSVEAITVSGDLSDWLGYEVSPTIVWDHPTVAAIATYLAQEM